ATGAVALGDALGEPGLDENAVEAAEAVPVQVRVRVFAPDNTAVGEALEGVSVALHTILPPHTLQSTQRGTTDAQGFATFELNAQAGAEAHAEVDNGRRYFSEALPLDAGGEHTIDLSVIPVTRDPSVLFAASMQTIVEPWEDYVIFTQVWTFGVDTNVIFESTVEEMGSIIQIPLPEGAEGVTVVLPEEDSRVLDGVVATAATVTPAGLDDGPARPHLIVRFSLPTDGKSYVGWTQRLTMDVERASVVVPQVTVHEKHPTIDISFDVPICGESEQSGMMCFREISEQAEGVMMRDDVPVVVARGRASAGETMSVMTRGWPAPVPWPRWLALGLGALTSLFGSLLYRRELRVRRAAGDAKMAARDALQRQAQELTDALSELRLDLEEGRLLERDYAIARARIREQLGVVYRRLREFGELIPGVPADSRANRARLDTAGVRDDPSER
ncbi:MAG: hypothetical protein ACJA1R_002665, partial [Flavobacteriales bacterium]